MEWFSLAPFVTSLGLVALAEMGDKTQLLTLLLVCKYQRTWPVLWGIVVATLANHALAALAGIWVASLIPSEWLTLILGIAFILMAAWTLIPDRDDDLEARPATHIFWTTTVIFFLVEVGDKTQIATGALAATFDSLFVVVLASTIGMVLANGPVIWLGARFACHIPLRLIRGLASGLFLLLGGWLVFEGSRGLF